jgi:hypothetical protein
LRSQAAFADIELILHRGIMTLERSFCGSLAVALLASAAGWAEINEKRYLEDVKYLASEELRGRGTGTPGLEKAALYLEREFRKIGLTPIGDQRYRQSFRVTAGARLGRKNQATLVDKGRRQSLRLGQDFRPLSLSSTGMTSAEMVFAGYGITAREYGYDDYAGVDVNGRFVILLRHEPRVNDRGSIFMGRNLTEHAQTASKAANARAHGAAGVILVSGAGDHGGADELESFLRLVGPADSGIPFVQVRSAVADQWLTASGTSVKQLEEAIDKEMKPRSFALPRGLRRELRVDIRRRERLVANVAGYRQGEDAEYVVIGAHYDHLGLGEQLSLEPSKAGTLHPGADDNASGTAGVVELARHLAALPKQKRGILFLCFAGEELGLLGSSYYVNHPALPLEKAAAMINLDMIGRVRDGKVIVGGAAAGTPLRGLLEEVAKRRDLQVDFTGEATYGSSDHASFAARQVPALFFFSGLHGDYHRPSDTWDRIDSAGAARLLRMVADVAARLAGAAPLPRSMCN